MIEDDPGHALLIKKNLHRNGVKNRLVHLDNGQDALDYFASYPVSEQTASPVLVWLDLHLPQVHGFDVLHYLKTNDNTKHIPVIVSTSSNNPQEIERCYALGCDMCLVKPVDQSRFNDALRHLGIVLHMPWNKGE